MVNRAVARLTRWGVIAARGTTQWVRNVRAADGHLALLLGRRREEPAIS